MWSLSMRFLVMNVHTLWKSPTKDKYNLSIEFRRGPSTSHSRIPFFPFYETANINKRLCTVAMGLRFFKSLAIRYTFGIDNQTCGFVGSFLSHHAMESILNFHFVATPQNMYRRAQKVYTFLIIIKL